MKYIINYSLSFGSKICSTCNGTGMVTIITADSQVRWPCPSLSCFDNGAKFYTESRFTIKGKKVFTSQPALNMFCERLYRIKMGLAFHYAGEIFRGLPDIYRFYRGGFKYNKAGNFGYAELSATGQRVAKMLPYHNKLTVEISRKY